MPDPNEERIRVAAVMATGLFGERFPEWFGSIGESMYTLFQVMTLESWSMGIARPVIEVYPWAWAFFVPFILIATFTMLNLFIGVIIGSMQEAQEEVANAGRDRDPPAALADELRDIARRLEDLQRDVGTPGREPPT